MGAKLPSFQFYPGDWQKDPDLRRCCHAAKGVWVDMLCLMFECEQRGVLATSGTAWTDDEIVRAVGGDHDVTLACLRELVEKRVAHRDDRGAVYSRRLVRDEDSRRNGVTRMKRFRNAHVTPASHASSSSASTSSFGIKGGSSFSVKEEETRRLLQARK
jgi:hypothetical protein